MDSRTKENVILYDWLSFTSKKHTPQELIEALGMSDCPWMETRGARGYRDRLYFGNISIHYNGRDDMGVWCELSGQGCRAFEDLTTCENKWQDIFSFIHKNKLHITRLDVAFDDHTGILDMKQLAQDVQEQCYVSRMRYWEVLRSNKGLSCQIGSPKSKVLIRIYDKAAERGFTDRHWVRVELQMRDSRAEEFLKIPKNVGEAFVGVLLNYLRFVEPNKADDNKSRWKMKDYWAKLIGNAGRIKIFKILGGAYNLERCRRYVFEMAGNAIEAMMSICGDIDSFMMRLALRSCKKNPKYDLLVKEHFAKLEAYDRKKKSKPEKAEKSVEEPAEESTVFGFEQLALECPV